MALKNVKHSVENTVVKSLHVVDTTVDTVDEGMMGIHDSVASWRKCNSWDLAIDEKEAETSYLLKSLEADAKLAEARAKFDAAEAKAKAAKAKAEAEAESTSEQSEDQQ